MFYFSSIICLIQCNSKTEGGQIKNIGLTTMLDNEYINWYHRTPNDSMAGIAMDKAYEYVSNQKPKKKIIVALIDSQLDIYHEELRGAIYINPDEIPGNNLDDDNNGYIDDINGWNYLGTTKGGSIEVGNFQTTRIIRALQRKYGILDLKSFSIEDNNDSALLQSAIEDSKYGIERAQRFIDWAKNLKNLYFEAQERYSYVFVDKSYTLNILDSVVPKDEQEKKVLDNIRYLNKNNLSLEDINSLIEDAYARKYICYNLAYNPYAAIDSIPETLSYTGYGHGRVADNPIRKKHATQVAGPMMAKRGNLMGIKGVSNNIQLMVLAVIPYGASRDKDFINAVHYAVDNGARIINYSAGDFYLEHEKEFYEAIEYAHKNGVLFVASAGNSNKDIDDPFYYYHPTGNSFSNSTRFNTFIKVGGINPEIGTKLKTKASNYGKKNVDIFAPGAYIKTTNATQSKYIVLGGTSIASSITSGVAAFILSYYPELSAAQIKDILLSSSTKYDKAVIIKDSTVINFKELSRSGGVINAYNAIRMAEEVVNSKK